MTKEEIIGYTSTPEQMEQYFLRCIDAEKKMGPLSREERITILKSVGTPVTLDELTDMMAGKRILMVKNEKHTEG